MVEWESIRDQIYANMQLKTTEELQEIWAKNDRDEWSDMAFNVVKEILIQRTGEIPQLQNPYQKKIMEKVKNRSLFKLPKNRIIRMSTIGFSFFILFCIILVFVLPNKNDLYKGILIFFTIMFGSVIYLLFRESTTIYYAWSRNAKDFREWTYDQSIYNFDNKNPFVKLVERLVPDWYILWTTRIFSPLALLIFLTAILIVIYTIYKSNFG